MKLISPSYILDQEPITMRTPQRWEIVSVNKNMKGNMIAYSPVFKNYMFISTPTYRKVSTFTRYIPWVGKCKITKLYTDADVSMIVRCGHGYAPEFVDKYHIEVKLPKKAWRTDTKILWERICEVLDTGTCNHEYDCCGCKSSRVNADFVRVSRSRVRVSVSISANY